MQVVIVGCGRMGSIIANDISRNDDSVIVIDRQPSSFDALNSDFSGFTIEGDASQVEVLKNAKIEQADLVLALTPDDNLNLAITQMAVKYFNVPEAIAKVSDPAREILFTKLGVKTICPTTISSKILLDEIRKIHKD